MSGDSVGPPPWAVRDRIAELIMNAYYRAGDHGETLGQVADGAAYGIMRAGTLLSPDERRSLAVVYGYEAGAYNVRVAIEALCNRWERFGVVAVSMKDVQAVLDEVAPRDPEAVADG